MGAKGEQTKRLICMEAYKLFSEKGYKDVTIKDICERTGLAAEACIDIMKVQSKFF